MCSKVVLAFFMSFSRKTGLKIFLISEILIFLSQGNTYFLGPKKPKLFLILIKRKFKRHLNFNVICSCSSAWIEHLPSKQGVAGSNPVGSVSFY